MTSLRRREELQWGLIIRHIRHITRRARILPKRIPEINRRHPHRLEDRTAVVAVAHRRPVHPSRVPLHRRQAGDQAVFDDQGPGGERGTDAVVEVDGVGSHAFEVHAAVAFHARGGGAAGAGFEGEGLADGDAGAGGVVGLDAAVGEGFDVALVPEVAVRVVEMSGVGGVDAAEVARGVVCSPGIVVVAVFDLDGCGAFAVASHGEDFALGEHLDALVHPEGAAQDGKVVAVVDVEHLVGVVWVAVDARFGESAAAEVECPAGEAVESHVVVPVQGEA